MKKFEVGHVYFDQYACDHETLTTIKIIKRTAKTVTFERNGKTRRAKLYENADGEYIIPIITAWPRSTAQSVSCWTKSRSSLPQRIIPSASRLLHNRLPPLATLSLACWLTTPCAKWCFPSLTRATCGQRNWTSLQPSPTAPAAWPDKGRCWAFWQRLFFCPIHSQMRVKMLSCLWRYLP